MIKELIDQLIAEVTTLKGPSLVVVFIIFIGYALKMSRFPNRCIPLVSFVIGPLLTPIMISWPEPGNMPNGVRWPEAAAWAQIVVMGFLLACIAWILHGKVLRKLIDDKVPALNPGRETNTKVAAETKTTDTGTEQTIKEETITTEVKPPISGG